MDILQTITHPWREPFDYFELVIWVVIFAVVAFAFYDMMRILASFIANAVS